MILDNLLQKSKCCNFSYPAPFSDGFEESQNSAKNAYHAGTFTLKRAYLGENHRECHDFHFHSKVAVYITKWL